MESGKKVSIQSQNQMNFSLCLTNYNRYEMLIEAFEKVIAHPKISEIVISDDYSDDDVYNKLKEYSELHPKIKLFRNRWNNGMSLNKKLAIQRATNDWCILFDSDNIISSEYVDIIAKIDFDDTIIYAPVMAAPNFDYSIFSNQFIGQDNIKNVIKSNEGNCLMNTCNYVVNRKKYLEVYRYDPDIKGSDTIHFNYLWLKNAGKIHVVPDLEYYHRVHSESGWLQDADYNQKTAAKTIELINKL